MRTKYFFTVLLLLIIESVYAQENNCFRITEFGEPKVCLPEIEGYVECYEEPNVKQLADGTEVESNIVLGFYVNENTYQIKDSIGLVRIDDYFKIYGTKQIKDYEADTGLLEQMKEILNGSFLIKNWDLLKKEIDDIGLDVEVGTPTVINSYQINENSFTFIMITKYEVEGMEPYTLAMSVNGYLHNKRLIWMAYYLNYEDEETITNLEKRSNIILTELMSTDN